MLKKSYSKTGKSCRVTFKLPCEEQTEKVLLLGDFNSWSPATHPMKARKDGTFSITVSLDAGREYRFRYLRDDQAWENDEAADQLVPNPFGTHDSVVAV